MATESPTATEGSAALHEDAASTAPPPEIREQECRGGTGHKSWHAASLLAAVLMNMEVDVALASQEAHLLTADHAEQATMPETVCAQPAPLAPQTRKDRRVLELGAGTGSLAVALAREGWRGITATDGDAAVVKNMKYNVHANHLGHAIRCRKWDWSQQPPKDLDLSDIDLCIASEVVYYNRTHEHLAATLRRVLTSRAGDEVRPPPRVLIMLTVRQPESTGGNVVHSVDNRGYEGSCIETFVDKELPNESLVATRLSIPDTAVQSCRSEAAREVYRSQDVVDALRFYEISLVA
mmetsp:Transcript_84229/g.234985  ORF Transcript_84229/g.234985 Transcript_84229/m.234985 type:complete len:294 (+) Transcript_84229:75-956(+)